jgi:hypothetical protein
MSKIEIMLSFESVGMDWDVYIALMTFVAGKACIGLGWSKKTALSNSTHELELEKWIQVTNSDFFRKCFLFLKVNSTEHLYFC